MPSRFFREWHQSSIMSALGANRDRLEDRYRLFVIDGLNDAQKSAMATIKTLDNDATNQMLARLRYWNKDFSMRLGFQEMSSHGGFCVFLQAFWRWCLD